MPPSPSLRKRNTRHTNFKGNGPRQEEGYAIVVCLRNSKHRLRHVSLPELSPGAFWHTCVSWVLLTNILGCNLRGCIISLIVLQ